MKKTNKSGKMGLTEFDAFIEERVNDVVEEIEILKEKPLLKFKTYMALLTTNDSYVKATVLNADSDDYLGDIVWARETEGVYVGMIPGFSDMNTTFVQHGSFEEPRLIQIYVQDSSTPTEEAPLTIFSKNISGGDFVPIDGIYNMPIEIKIRQRGEAPKVISSSIQFLEEGTNNVIIIEFDKKLNDLYRYLDMVEVVNKIRISKGGPNVYPEQMEVIDNKMYLYEVDANWGFTKNDIITVDIVALLIESIDFGLLSSLLVENIKNNLE